MIKDSRTSQRRGACSARPATNEVRAMLEAMLEPTEIASGEFRPLRRAEYERLAELGFFDDEKVELLDGVIVKMSPIGEDHNVYEALLNELIVKALPPHLIVRPQCSFPLSDISEPQPDLAIVERKRLPSPALLIIELADSSLNKDLGLKAKLYAAAGVPDYWVVDLRAMAIDVHRGPVGTRFTTVQRFDRTSRVQALLVPEIVVCLDEQTL
jgi:Uma2 family endonuclease